MFTSQQGIVLRALARNTTRFNQTVDSPDLRSGVSKPLLQDHVFLEAQTQAPPQSHPDFVQLAFAKRLACLSSPDLNKHTPSLSDMLAYHYAAKALPCLSR